MALEADCSVSTVLETLRVTSTARALGSSGIRFRDEINPQKGCGFAKVASFPRTTTQRMEPQESSI